MHGVDIVCGACLACAARKTLTLGDRVADMLRRTMDVFERNDAKAVTAVEDADAAADPASWRRPGCGRLNP